MSLSSTEPENWAGSWSLNARLTALYTLSAFALLFVSTVFLFWTLRRDLDRKNGQFVADKVHELRTIINEQSGNADALQREVVRETTVSIYWRYFARVLNADGDTLLETPGMHALLPAAIFPPPSGIISAATRERIQIASDGRAYMLLASDASEPGTRGGPHEIQFALDVTQEDLLLADYRRKMAVVLAFGLVVAAAAGAVVARKGLRPLEQITAAASRIRATRLHERIGERKWPRELAELAAVFDEMLGRLEDSFTRLSQFSADLAHELRTPINNLLGEAGLALSRTRTADEYRQVLESSMEEYNRLAQMIESLLFLARADADRAPLQMKQLNAHAEIEAVCEFYEAVAAEREIEVTCRGEAVLLADQMLFRRALSNLLSNALNHTSPHGHIDLLVDQSTAGVVEVRVTDTGCGIAPEHLPKIFDRFYRVDPSRSQQSRGTGLGLAIVRSIVQLHGGTASIVSEPGKGTTVLLTFSQPPETAQITKL
jgi:two-component system heavy metal sensor histidine kinase CusS